MDFGLRRVGGCNLPKPAAATGSLLALFFPARTAPLDGGSFHLRGSDHEAAGRTKGTRTLRSRIDGRARQTASCSTSCRRGSEAPYRVRPVIRWRPRCIVCHIVPPEKKEVLVVPDPGSRATYHAACRSRCLLSEASSEETQEARTDLNRVSPCRDAFRCAINIRNFERPQPQHVIALDARRQRLMSLHSFGLRLARRLRARWPDLQPSGRSSSKFAWCLPLYGRPTASPLDYLPISLTRRSC
jgi:hypothetical protein